MYPDAPSDTRPRPGWESALRRAVLFADVQFGTPVSDHGMSENAISSSCAGWKNGERGLGILPVSATYWAYPAWTVSSGTWNVGVRSAHTKALAIAIAIVTQSARGRRRARRRGSGRVGSRLRRGAVGGGEIMPASPAPGVPRRRTPP